VRRIELERIETARIVCERLGPEHGAKLAPLLRDPRVARTTSPTLKPPTTAEVNEGLRRQDEHWRRHGFGLWLLRDRHSGAMIGRGGLQYMRVEGRDEVEIAWAIVPERWGEGLATELARKSLEIAFQDLELDQLIVLTLVDNRASRRVAEKAGFVRERSVEHAGLLHLLYRLPAPSPGR
jgi:[ribosomal protein S5]-alanine N-acetyltransferase